MSKTLIKNKNFSRLYLAGLTSELGSFITETALMLLVFALTNQNNSYLGIIRAAFLFFLTFGGIIGGPLGEKFNRKKLLIFCNIIRIPTLFLLFLFRENPHMVILCNGLIALFTGIYNPSRQALINELVEPENITKANSLFGSTFAILHILGPFIGASAYSYFNGVSEVLYFDLFTYIIGIFLLTSIAYTAPEKEQEQKGFFTELTEGFSYINKRKDLKAMIINCALAGSCIGLLIPLLLPYIRENLGRPESDYGLLISIFGIGGFFGGILCNYLSKKFRPGQLIYSSIAFEPFIFFAWLLKDDFYYTLCLHFLWGVAVFVRISSHLNHISKTVETKYLTRMHSLLDLSFIFPNILSGIVIALIGSRFTTMDILKSSALLFFLLIIPRLFFPGMRALFRYNKTIER